MGEEDTDLKGNPSGAGVEPILEGAYSDSRIPNSTFCDKSQSKNMASLIQNRLEPQVMARRLW